VPQAEKDSMDERKISCLCRESNPGRPARHYTDWAMQSLHISESPWPMAEVLPAFLLIILNHLSYFDPDCTCIIYLHLKFVQCR
jgi:hypothetical protein